MTINERFKRITTAVRALYPETPNPVVDVRVTDDVVIITAIAGPQPLELSTNGKDVEDALKQADDLLSEALDTRLRPAREAFEMYAKKDG